jgi:Kef-type K+ transport system membrane component KefB
MTNDLFQEISVMIAIGSVIGLIMHLLRQPLIVGHIITGIIIGPSLLNIFSSAETVAVFSKIGIALLLFIIGLGLNPKVIKELGKVSVVVGFVQMGLTLLISSLVAVGMGFPLVPALIIGTALSFSSTIIILKLISDKKEQGRLYGKISIGVLLVQDLVATLALFGIIALEGSGLAFNQYAWLILKGILLGLSLVIAGLYVLPRLNKIIAGSQEFLFLFSIGWGLGVASLFEISGFSIEVGALAAGVALASAPYVHEASSRLRPLRDFFIVVFFISLGIHLKVESIYAIWLPVLVFSSIVVIVKPLVVLLILGFLGYTKKTSFRTAVAMAQISEFSLVLALLANRAGSLDDEALLIVTLVMIISIAVSTYLIIYTDKIYKVLEDKLSLFERRKIHYDQEAANKYQMILFGYNKGGNEFIKVFRELDKSFVVIDYDPEVVDRLEYKKVNFLYGDATDPEMHEEIGSASAKLIVSTISDIDVNRFLVSHINEINPRCVIICPAETPEHATELYELGATYVMMPHYIGSEKISSFIRRNGFKRSEFKKWRDRHLLALREHAQHIAQYTES